MSTQTELQESWLRLTDQDCSHALRIAADARLIRVSPELCGHVQGMLRNAMQHRHESRVMPDHDADFWESLDHRQLSKAWLASMAFRAAAISSEVLQEWACAVSDAAASTMANRLAELQRIIDEQNAAYEN